MKKLMLLAGILIYIAFMTSCAGGHDHEGETNEAHTHEAGAETVTGTN